MLSELTMIKIYSDNNLLKLITTMATTVENRGGFSFLSIFRSITVFYFLVFSGKTTILIKTSTRPVVKWWCINIIKILFFYLFEELSKILVY